MCPFFLRLHKPKIPEPPKSVISESDQSEISKDDVFAELEELMGPGTDVIVPPKFGMLLSSKSFHFGTLYIDW